MLRNRLIPGIVAAGLMLSLQSASAGADLGLDLPASIFAAPRGTAFQLDGTLQNDGVDSVYVNGMSTTLTDDYAAADLYDAWNSSAPVCLGPGEGWSGGIVKITVSSQAPLESAVFEISLFGGSHPYATDLLGTADFLIDTSTGVSAVPELPAGGTLRYLAAAPNPFGLTTTIRIDLESSSDLDVAIFDVAGRPIRSLHSGHAGAGPAEFSWDGRDGAGASTRAGIYFVRARAGGRSLSLKIARTP